MQFKPFFSEWQKVKSPPVDITLFKMLFVVVWCSNIFLFIFELFYARKMSNQSWPQCVTFSEVLFFLLKEYLLCIFPIQENSLGNFCGVFHNAMISAWKCLMSIFKTLYVKTICNVMFIAQALIFKLPSLKLM